MGGGVVPPARHSWYYELVLKIFTGYDPREAAGSYVFANSVISRASVPVAFSFLGSGEKQHTGSNAFTYARYLCAHLAHYTGGPIVFADGADQICLADVAELLDRWDPRCAVQVVRRAPYRATPRKFMGTPMESVNTSYPCKQWSSFMLISPSHYGWRRVRSEETTPDYWHGFGWLKDGEIGDLPNEWNRLVDEGDAVEGGKILHWTLGVPALAHYKNSPGAELWRAEAQKAFHVCDPDWTRRVEELCQNKNR